MTHPNAVATHAVNLAATITQNMDRDRRHDGGYVHVPALTMRPDIREVWRDVVPLDDAYGPDAAADDAYEALLEIAHRGTDALDAPTTEYDIIPRVVDYAASIEDDALAWLLNDPAARAYATRLLEDEGIRNNDPVHLAVTARALAAERHARTAITNLYDAAAEHLNAYAHDTADAAVEDLNAYAHDTADAAVEDLNASGSAAAHLTDDNLDELRDAIMDDPGLFDLAHAAATHVASDVGTRIAAAYTRMTSFAPDDAATNAARAVTEGAA